MSFIGVLHKNSMRKLRYSGQHLATKTQALRKPFVGLGIVYVAALLVYEDLQQGKLGRYFAGVSARAACLRYLPFSL